MSRKKIVYIPVSELIPDKYQLLPPWPEMELAQLIAEVKEGREIREPLQIDEAKHILDGHHRLHAAKAAGLEEVPCIVREGLTEEQKVRIVFGQLYKRQLDYYGKQKLLDDLLVRFSDRTNTYVALLTNVSDKTVAARRGCLIAAGRIPDHDRLTGIDGKSYTVERPKAAPVHSAAGGTPEEDDDEEKDDEGEEEAQPKPAQPKKQRAPHILRIGVVSTDLYRSGIHLRVESTPVLKALMDQRGAPNDRDHLGQVRILVGWDSEAEIKEAREARVAVLILP